MNQLVFFSYHDGSRSSKVVLELFKDFRGAIQTDGYAGYNILDKFDGITTLLCWAHCRRYFDRALSNDKDRAEYALTQIGMLYDVEHMADDQDMNFEERSALRKRLAFPIMRAFEKWCITEYPQVLPKSPIGKAISYFLSYSRQLSRYTMDGRYKPDNNLIENSVRPVAIGRKNYLFCGNHDAAENAAIIYSLMGCCKGSSSLRAFVKRSLSSLMDIPKFPFLPFSPRMAKSRISWDLPSVMARNRALNPRMQRFCTWECTLPMFSVRLPVLG